MQKVGKVQSVWRYPVKGMAGEALNSCALTEVGLQGDRVMAVQDVKRQEIQSCKFRPALLQCGGEFSANGNGVQVRFPDGSRMLAKNPEIHEKISALIGHESVLQQMQPLAGNEPFYRRYKTDGVTWLKELKATFEREPGEPLPDLDHLPAVMQEYVTVPGTFFLVAPFHLLTTASLDHMRQFKPESDWAIERFRPNLVIETLPDLVGLVEQQWLNRTLVIGDAELSCVAAAPRCGAVVKKQQGLAEDRDILRHIVKQADQNLGVYGLTAKPGELRVGMDVWLM